jgi:Tfp pilus assembly protein PilP
VCRVVALMLTVLVSTAVAVSANALRPRKALEYFELSELSLIVTKPSRNGRSAVFLDSKGGRHRVRVGDMIANDFVSLGSVRSRGVTIGKLVQEH